MQPPTLLLSWVRHLRDLPTYDRRSLYIIQSPTNKKALSQNPCYMATRDGAVVHVGNSHASTLTLRDLSVSRVRTERVKVPSPRDRSNREILMSDFRDV